MSILIENKSGFEGRLTEQQGTALTELKTRMATSEYAKEIATHPDGDRWILRFLRATMKDKHGDRVFQVEAAEARLLKTMEFRRKYGLEEMMHLIVAGELEKAKPKSYDRYLKAFPNLRLTIPENGDIVMYDRFGTSIASVDIDMMSWDDWTLAVGYNVETLMQVMRDNSKKFGKEISNYTDIVDASGITLSGVISRRKMLQYMSDLGGEYYPETLGKTFMCSCPWYFDKIYSLVKPFIDKDTLGKLCITSSKTPDGILELIPKSMILKEWDGDNEAVLPQPVFQ